MAKTEDVVAVTKLELKIAGETIRPTIEQARKLYEALAELFAKPAPEIRVEKEYINWPIWKDYSYGRRGFEPTWTMTTTGNKSTTNFLSLDMSGYTTTKGDK